MAVADAAVKPAPPPPPAARIVVAVLALVRFVLAAMLAFGRVAARALPYLFFATVWVISAGSAAKIVARHACREGSAILVFLEAFTDVAFKFYICSIFVLLALLALLLCGLCLVAAVSGSGPEFKKSVFQAIKQDFFEAIKQESTKESIKPPRAVVLGVVADFAFVLLIAAGILVDMVSPHVEGSISQGQMVASLIVDVGIFGLHAMSCFLILPALALVIWRHSNSGRKAGVTVADC